MGNYTNLLFSKTQQRVLSLLFGRPDAAFYTSEIIAFVGLGSGTVQRELSRLEESALVTTKQVGNHKFYQANKNSPIFNELRAIVVKTFGVADVLRGALEPIDAQIECAFIYGSMAKGTETASSDIDLMVVGSLTNQVLLAQLSAASATLGRAINPTLYTAQELAERVDSGKAFVTKVLDLPKIFIKGADDDLLKYRA